jgi:hypothetical protein
MKANRLVPRDHTSESHPAPGQPSIEDLLTIADELEKKLKPNLAEDLSRTVRLLAMIANDDQVCVQNPGRVVEAFQNHGHLLCDFEVEMLRDWLVALDQSH